MKSRSLLFFLALIGLNSCEFCETKGTITFDNTERLWCNCEVTFPNGDVYVINAGEQRTYEFFQGTHEIDAYCGNGAWQNDFCGLEEGVISRTFDVDCGDNHVMNLNF